jgi:hypothetical protein
MAVLVSILVPNFLAARAASQATACEANETDIAAAAESYFVIEDAYPSAGQVQMGGTFDVSGLPSGLFLNNTPKDPTNQALYTFTPVAGSATQLASYTILCGGLHPSYSIKKLQAATSNSTQIEYSPATGLQAGN